MDEDLWLTGAYDQGHPLPPGWRRLTDAEYDSVWDRFYSTFDFHPSVDRENWPGIREPHPSTTYAIDHAFGDADRYDVLQADLASRLMAAFRRCCSPGYALYALDWQHTCYRLEPHQHPDGLSPFAWPVPSLPDGDYYIFLADDLRFGVFGHPWEQTMCAFGDPLLEALAVETPQLFTRTVRIDGFPAT